MSNSSYFRFDDDNKRQSIYIYMIAAVLVVSDIWFCLNLSCLNSTQYLRLRSHLLLLFVMSFCCYLLLTWFALHCFSSVHCTNIIHPRKLSFVITPPPPHSTPVFLVNTVNRYFFNIRSNKIRHILLKSFHLATLSFKSVKHPLFSTYVSATLVQGLQTRHNPACFWSPQCTGNHSYSL